MLSVATYPFYEHNAPPFELIKPFCEDMETFLKADSRKVAAIHSKSGKVCVCAHVCVRERGGGKRD